MRVEKNYLASPVGRAAQRGARRVSERLPNLPVAGASGRVARAQARRLRIDERRAAAAANADLVLVHRPDLLDTEGAHVRLWWEKQQAPGCGQAGLVRQRDLLVEQLRQQAPSRELELTDRHVQALLRVERLERLYERAKGQRKQTLLRELKREKAKIEPLPAEPGSAGGAAAPRGDPGRAGARHRGGARDRHRAGRGRSDPLGARVHT